MIIVIGASGFIGTYLTDSLLRKGYDVLATGRSPRAARFFESRGIPFLHLDITRREDFDLLPTEGVEAVILLAATLPANEEEENPYRYIASNLEGTVHALEYCRRTGVRKFISTTSYADVSGHFSADHVIDDDELRSYNLVDDHSEYIITKNAATDMILHYNLVYGLQGCIFRFPPVYGVGPHSQLRTDGVLRKSGFQIFVDKASSGEDLEVYGDKDVVRDIVYIEDVCDAFAQAIESDRAAGVYNIMSGESSSLEQQARDIIAVFGDGKGSKVIFSPEKKNNSRSYRFSIEKARRDFGYNPRFVPFRKLCEAYREEMENPRFPHLLPTQTLLILGAGSIQVPIIRKAREAGFRTVVADYDPKAPGFAYSDVKSTVSTVDFDAVLGLARAENIDGILTTSEYPVNVVAYVGEALGLPSMSREVASVCTNKLRQREIFAANGLNVPFFKLISETDPLEPYADFPYVVKPVDSSASRGVTLVRDAAELKKAVDFAREYSRSGKVLLESVIGGSEFSVETLTQNGETHIVNITEKATRGDGCFVEDTHIEPARISEAEWKIISDEVLRGIKAIGLDNCPSHTEVKLWNGRAYIIEMACRLGGDYITSDLVPLSTGVDMLGNLINLALGRKIDAEPRFSKCSCVQFLNESNYSRAVEFINSGDSHIVRSEVLPYSADPILDSGGRLGYVILQAERMDEIEAILEKIR
ncbi:MAG: NAD-dependent epimerase/dehydratase family protein [Bacteroidales bacterium]|nr:NAD-dependent epimerase/dehydratase family protein [Candidatus Cryptobacteroides choladohippi]